MEQQISFLDLLSGKTFQEPLAATREKTSNPSSKRFVASGGGQDHIVPMSPKNKWLPCGTIVGDGWSVAWRVYDAQFWGVPQRRKRIYLIADFGSERAGEILFECESVRGDSAESGEAREGTSADVEGSAGRSDCAIGCDLYNGQLTGDKAATLGANSGASANHAGPSVCLPAAFMGGQGAKARSIAYCDDGTTPTLKSAPSGGNTVPDVCYPNVARSILARHDSSPCGDRGQNFICVQNTGRGWWNEGEVAETLRTPCGGDSTKANLVVAVDCRNMCVNEELSATIQAKNEGGHSLNYINPIVYDARGNGGGMTVPTITGDHQNRVSDYTCICVERNHDE